MMAATMVAEYDLRLHEIYNAQLNRLVSARKAVVCALEAVGSHGDHTLVLSCCEDLLDLLDIVKTARLLLSETQISEDVQQCTLLSCCEDLDNLLEIVKTARLLSEGGGLLLSKTNSSGYAGVFQTSDGAFRACLRADNQDCRFGIFKTAVDAANAIKSVHSMPPAERVLECKRQKTQRGIEATRTNQIEANRIRSQRERERSQREAEACRLRRLAPEEKAALKMYKCLHDGCGRDFMTKQKLDFHAVQHLAPEEKAALKTYKCLHDGCGRDFMTKQKLGRHAQTCTPFKIAARQQAKDGAAALKIMMQESQRVAEAADPAALGGQAATRKKTFTPTQIETKEKAVLLKQRRLEMVFADTGITFSTTPFDFAHSTGLHAANIWDKWHP